MPPKSAQTGLARPQDSNRASRARPLDKLYRPGFSVAAIVLLWAAVNEPDQLTAVSVIVWLLTAAAVALLACAVLALGQPVVKLGGARLLRALREGSGKAGGA